MYKQIKTLRKTLHLSQEAFGTKLGVTRSVINNLERNLTELKDPLKTLLCSTFNVNSEWLCTGIGDMFVTPEMSYLHKLQQEYALSPTEMNIVSNFIQMNSLDRDKFTQLLRGLVKE